MNNRIRRAAARSILLTCTGIVFSTVSPDSKAVDLEAALNIGVGYTDNLGRASEQSENKSIAVAGLMFSLENTSKKVNAFIRSDLQYMYYDLEEYDDEIIGGAEAKIDYELIKDRFEWTIQDNYGQQLLDPFLPAQPNNRESINFFNTGPTLMIPLGARNQIQVQGRYTAVDYEISPFDNTGSSVGVQLGRYIREDMMLSLNGNIDRTEYDNEEFSQDYDRAEYFLQLSSMRGKNQFSIDLGYTELDFGSQVTSEGELARIAWTRQLSTVSTFTLYGGTGFSSQADRLRYVQSNQREIGDTVDIEGQDVPFKNDYFGAAYDLAQDRNAYQFGLEWTEEDFEGLSDRSRDLWRAYAIVRRDVTRRLFGQLNIQFFRREYADITREDDDTNIMAQLGFRWTENIAVSLQYMRFIRNSNLNTDEFTENRAFLQLTYIPDWAK